MSEDGLYRHPFNWKFPIWLLMINIPGIDISTQSKVRDLYLFVVPHEKTITTRQITMHYSVLLQILLFNIGKVFNATKVIFSFTWKACSLAFTSISCPHNFQDINWIANVPQFACQVQRVYKDFHFKAKIFWNEIS